MFNYILYKIKANENNKKIYIFKLATKISAIKPSLQTFSFASEFVYFSL